MQDRPRCFGCSDVVEYDPLYEAPCGHDDCPSAVFHGLCLMEWREKRHGFTQFAEMMNKMLQAWFEQHSEGDRE